MSFSRSKDPETAVLITVCVPTFRRPELLRKLLAGVAKQEKGSLFSLEVIVVDNDRNRSAQGVVEDFNASGTIPARYLVEPVQNISLARNMALDNARGDFIAFIDDDEWPTPHWLGNLLKTLRLYDADGVLGPVLPHFDSDPPRWLIRGGFCDRPRHKTGSLLPSGQTRTGNVLFTARLTRNRMNRFLPEFGRSGGEDIEFFRGLIGQGRRFVWCDEAEVYETVTEDRWTRRFYLKKYFRLGSLNGEKARGRAGKRGLVLKSMTAWVFYTAALPFSPLLGFHRFMKCLTLFLYHLGTVLGFSGLVLIRYRDNADKENMADI